MSEFIAKWTAVFDWIVKSTPSPKIPSLPKLPALSKGDPRLMLLDCGWINPERLLPGDMLIVKGEPFLADRVEVFGGELWVCGHYFTKENVLGDEGRVTFDVLNQRAFVIQRGVIFLRKDSGT